MNESSVELIGIPMDYLAVKPITKIYKEGLERFPAKRF